MKGYPRGFLATLWTVCMALLATGLLLAPTTLELRLGWQMPWRLGGGARVGVAAMHAALAFLLLFVIGALWSIHMRAGWRQRRQRKTGAMLVCDLLGLALSALGVYYLGDSGVADATALAHLSLGVLLALPLAVHAMTKRRHRRSARRPSARRHAGAGRRSTVEASNITPD